MSQSALFAKRRGTLLGVSAWRVPNWRFIVCLCLLGLALALPYSSALHSLFQLWLRQDKAYSHGFLVPLISLYLLWGKREYLSQLRPRPHQIAGGLGFLVSALLLFVGRSIGIIQAEVMAFLIVLPSLVLFVFGWGYLKALALPLVYLLFMLPPASLFFMVPRIDELTDGFHWPFQLISANLGVWAVQALGFPAFQEGTFIHLPRITLEVIEACSGLRFLTSVIAIGIPLVYLTQRTWPRATAVIASGVLITILSNGARVALVGIMAQLYGAEMLHGPYKLFQGWFVAQIGFIGLFVVNWAVCKLPSRSQTRLHERWKAVSCAPHDTDNTNRDWVRPFALAVSLLMGFGVYLNFFAAPQPIPPKRTLAEFPYFIGAWQGQESSLFRGENFCPGLDAEINRTYRTASGREVHFFVGYFESQFRGKSLVSHRDRPLQNGVRVIASELGTPAPQWVNQSTLSLGENRYSTLFWYRTNSGVLTGRSQVRLNAIFDAVVHRRNNGALILLAAPLVDQHMEALASKDLLGFAQALAPILGDFLP